MGFLSWMTSSFISFPESLLQKWRAPCKSQKPVSVFPLKGLCWFVAYDAQGELSTLSSEYRAYGCWNRLRQMLKHKTKPWLSQRNILWGCRGGATWPSLPLCWPMRPAPRGTRGAIFCGLAKWRALRSLVWSQEVLFENDLHVARVPEQVRGDECHVTGYVKIAKASFGFHVAGKKSGEAGIPTAGGDNRHS